MYKFNLVTIALALIMVFTGCTKDEVNPANSMNPDYHHVQRSTYSDIELLGMAANIDDIQYSSGSYNVSFHGSTASYSVDIVTCVIDSMIQIDITHGVQTSEAIIDFSRETLDIENDQEYSFRDLEDVQVSSSSNILFRVAATVIVQHLENPESSISFVDNGTSDLFPEEEPEDRKCCICSSSTINEYFPGLCTETTTQTIFWMDFTSTTDVDCP